MSDLNTKFDQEYKRLNTHQKEAVDTIEGPVMVVAGPGTGKTQILTLRIANILKQTDTAPANILALTFTESAAANMRKRLSNIVGSRAYQVVISTFHGFCNDVIKNYPEEFPRIIGSTNITEVDQIKIIEQLVETVPLNLLRPFGDPLLYVKPILSSINELKREGLSPAEFRKIVTASDQSFDQISDLRHEKGAHKGKVKSVYEKLRRQIDKNLELADVYEGYEKELAKQKSYDYSDMIMEVLRELRTNKTLLAGLQEEHQYILVDEHQDTNNAQNKVLELIAAFHDNPNLFVVGDEKQAVFRFQGASLENFYYFKTQYPEAKLVVLEDNYRSTQTILDQAQALLAGKAELKANTNQALEHIKIAACPSPQAELFLVASAIQKQIEAGVDPAEIAVLYRDNRDAFAVASVLEKLGIPVAIESDDNLLADNDVRKLLILYKAVYSFNDEALAQALHLDFLAVPPIETYRLIREAAHTSRPLITLLAETMPDLAERLSNWNTASHNLELLPFAEKVLKESQLLTHIVTSSTARKRLETIGVLFDTMSNLVAGHPEARLKDFLDFIDTVTKHQVLLKNKSRANAVGKVRLMTVHRSKGLEFMSVFIIGAYDGHFGGRTSRDKLKLLPAVYQLTKRADEKSETDAQDADDERRLFYVALTRAKRSVMISFSTLGDSGREQVPSQFITELKPELLEYVDTSTVQDELSNVQETLLSPAVVQESDLKDKEYLAGLFRDQGLSVTALNNYLICPWQYFYRNLIRLPSIPTKHQAYGIAVHAALRDAFKHAKEREITKDSLLASFEKYLHQEPLAEKDLQETLAKGLESLGGWFDVYHQTWTNNVLPEFAIKGVDLTPDIKLVGMLDKIEFVGDGGTVNVVDYKTGKPKSRNELMGATRDADGNYYRQLVFYKILLDLFENGKYNMISGEIDFVEPNDTGKYKKEKFEIPDTDVTELKETIKKVADEIVNLKFWDTTCDDKECEYCALRKLMQ